MFVLKINLHLFGSGTFKFQNCCFRDEGLSKHLDIFSGVFVARGHIVGVGYLFECLYERCNDL